MFNDAVDNERTSSAAAYVGRVSVSGSFRSEKAVLLVANMGLSLHSPGRFEKYRAIPYEEINFFDLRRRWNGMVLSIGTDGKELRFRFFRPRGDLAAIVVALNQRSQSGSKPLRPRYALTQVSAEAEAGDGTQGQQSSVPRRQSAFDELFSDATSGFEEAGPSAPPSPDRRDWSQHGPARGRAGSGTRVFAGDAPNLAPLARIVPKVIILCLALYSVVVSGLWQRGLDTIAGWLSLPEQEKAIALPDAVEEPALSGTPDRPAPAEENLTHVWIDLSEISDLAGILAAQRAAMNMSPANAAEEARIDPSVVEEIESASDTVNLADFLRYAKAIHLDINTTRNVIDSK